MKLKPTIITVLLLFFSFSDVFCDNTYRYDSNSMKQVELNKLIMILTQFGNNPENLQALDYAILKEDEYAVDLLLKYGATPGRWSLRCARKAGNLGLLKKIFDSGTRADDFDNDLLLNAIHCHQNDIAAYLIEHGNDLGDNVVQEDRDYFKACKQAGNMEIYNLLLSKGLGAK